MGHRRRAVAVKPPWRARGKIKRRCDMFVTHTPPEYSGGATPALRSFLFRDVLGASEPGAQQNAHGGPESA